MSSANSTQNTATVGVVIPEQVGHPSGSARRRAPPTGLRATAVATLRTRGHAGIRPVFCHKPR